MNLYEALETEMFESQTRVTQQLKYLLGKLGIKSASKDISSLAYGGILKVEDLQPTMKQVTFNIKKLKLWKKC